MVVMTVRQNRKAEEKLHCREVRPPSQPRRTASTTFFWYIRSSLSILYIITYLDLLSAALRFV